MNLALTFDSWKSSFHFHNALTICRKHSQSKPNENAQIYLELVIRLPRNVNIAKCIYARDTVSHSRNRTIPGNAVWWIFKVSCREEHGTVTWIWSKFVFNKLKSYKFNQISSLVRLDVWRNTRKIFCTQYRASQLLLGW